MKYVTENSILISIITLLILLLVCNCSKKQTRQNTRKNTQEKTKETFDANTLYTKGAHCPHKFNESCSCDSDYKIPYSQTLEAKENKYCPCSELNPECLLVKQPHFKIPEKVKNKCLGGGGKDSNGDSNEMQKLSPETRKEMLLRYSMLKSRKLDRYPWFD